MAREYTADALGSLAENVVGELQELLVKRVRIGTMFAMGEMLAEAPVADPTTWRRPRPHIGGRFRASILPWEGEMPETVPPADAAGYPVPDASDVLAVMENLEPGGKAGLVSNVEYAERLADGWSRQANAGWVDRIVVRTEDAMREVTL